MVTNIPMIPNLSSFSPRMRLEVKIIKAGLNAKNGNVNDKGDNLMAFMYNMSAVISNGSNVSTARKKYMSRLGISANGRSKSKNGAANPTRTQATRYSLLLASDFLQSASADAVKKPQRRDRNIQLKLNSYKNINELLEAAKIVQIKKQIMMGSICLTHPTRAEEIYRNMSIINYNLYPNLRSSCLRAWMSFSSSTPFGLYPSTTPIIPRPCSVSATIT